MVIFVNKSNETVAFSAAGCDISIGRNGTCTVPDEVAFEFFSPNFGRPGLRRVINVANADGTKFDPTTEVVTIPEKEELTTEEPSVAPEPDESVSTEETPPEVISEDKPVITKPTPTTIHRKQSGKSGKTVKLKVKP